MAKLKKNITYPVLLLLAINAIIGTGIFFVPGIAASIAGPASILSWVAVGFISLLIAACFAELSSLFPKSGGVYEYSKNAFGEFVGFIVGWVSWIVANITIAMLAIGGATYLEVLFNVPSYFGIIFAISFILIMNYISFRGIDLSIKVLVSFSIITITTLILISFFGTFTIDITRLQPLFVLPYITIFAAMYLILETFFGWETVTFLSEETKNPKTNVPKAIFWGTLIVIILAVVVVFVSLTSINWETLAASEYPLTEVISSFPKPVVFFVTGLILLNILGAAAAWIISTPRLIFAMARNNVLPLFLSRIHSKYRTPHFAILFQTIISTFVLISGSFQALLEILLPLAVIMYSIVILSVPKLRHKMPNVKRTFNVPFPTILPFLLVITLIAISLVGASMKGIILGFVLVLLGVPLYLIAILGYHKKFTRFFTNITGDFSYYTYSILVGDKVLKHIFNYLDDVTVRRVLDLGCGVGIATHQLAKRAIPLDGMAYGVDFSKRSINIAKRHRDKRDVKNLKFIEADLYNLGSSEHADKHLIELDAIVGLGVLGYLEEIDIVLKDVKKRLREDGKFYFVEYNYIGHLFNKSWIEDDKMIRELFDQAGLKVKIWREKGFLMEFVHIYGVKE